MAAPDPGMSDAAVIAATGHGWAHWQAHLDALGGRDLSHQAIVQSLGDAGVGHWWGQMVTVGYERMIGRRALGQKCTGDFAASASRTLACDMDDGLARWLALVAGRTEFAGAIAAGEPRVTRSDKWRYWRIDLDDGTRATIMLSAKPGGKCTIAADHEKLADSAAVAAAKAFWKALLAQL